MDGLGQSGVKIVKQGAFIEKVFGAKKVLEGVFKS